MIHPRSTVLLFAGLAALSIPSLGCKRAKVIVAAPSEPSPTQQPADDPLVVHGAVRETVRAYDRALATRNPADAKALVVDETFAHYDDLRRLALTATRDELERLDLMSVMLVLQLRNELSRAELEHFDGLTLFEWSVSTGLVGGSDDNDADLLDEVWIDDDGTRAEIRIEGQPVAFLRLVEDSWRMDIPAMIRMLGQVLGSIGRERIEADGKVATAMNLIQRGRGIDATIVDGPRDEGPGDATSAGSQSPAN